MRPNATPALSPQESLKQIVVDPGLKVELVASEPNVIDPVAIRFDEDGRMWVVRDVRLPDGPDEGISGPLADFDFDATRTATGFLKRRPCLPMILSFATGVQPWKGGVFVTMAGKVAYMKDTNGDGKADVNETWYTGFHRRGISSCGRIIRRSGSTITFTSPTGCGAATIVDARWPDVEAGFDQRHGFSVRSAAREHSRPFPASGSSV